MEKKKNRTALVLEGGGMRGAYTAGCLAWLLENGVDFDGAYGISSGGAHLTSYLWGKKDWLEEMSTYYIPEKSSIGLGGFLKEGQLVAFNYKFKNAKDFLGFTTDNLKTDMDAYCGLYDLKQGKPVYIHYNDMNDEMLKAAVSLPILFKTRKYNGNEYLDAGIRDMIPIEKALEDGYEKMLVITTKPSDYVRKKTNGFIVFLMSVIYKRCPNIAKDYKVRAENYYKQLNLIKKLENEGKAIYRYPTVNMKNISRFGGEKEDLQKLFDLGKADMEAIKEDIFSMFK